MHILVSDMKITNITELTNYIPSCMDAQELISLSLELSSHLINKDIDANDANILFSLIKNQINTLSNNSKVSEKGKRYSLNPVGRPTYLQSHEGVIHISLLIINILITAFMYACIIFARFIK